MELKLKAKEEEKNQVDEITLLFDIQEIQPGFVYTLTHRSGVKITIKFSGKIILPFRQE